MKKAIILYILGIIGVFGLCIYLMTSGKIPVFDATNNIVYTTTYLETGPAIALLVGLLAFLTSIFTNYYTNYKNEKNILSQLKQNKNILMLDLNKKDMKTAIEKAREFFLWNSVFIGDDEVIFFKLIIIKYKWYFEYLPKFIQKDISEFISEIIENNNLKLNDHLESIHNVYKIVEKGEMEFCYYYKNISPSEPFANDFRLVFDLFSKINDKDKKRIKNFCLEKSKSLKSNKIDNIFEREFFNNNNY